MAKADYPAARLYEMRRRFCEDARGLLDGLGLEGIPGYCVAWPVHGQAVAVPSSVEVGPALRPVGGGLAGHLQTVTANDEALRLAGPGAGWGAMAAAVERAADRILMQAHGEEYRAALFAMGSMPALIALGAKLGNKCGLTPMLRFRDSGSWYWPAKEPQGEFYRVVGVERLSDREDDVCLVLGLTAAPAALRSTAASIGMRTVTVAARAEVLGNGALGHPEDGAAFRQRMQELLHRLRDSHGVRRVHVLPCASNAACVLFGQAFDNYHPELLVYDFDVAGEAMVPALRLRNKDGGCAVDAAGMEGGSNRRGPGQIGPSVALRRQVAPPRSSRRLFTSALGSRHWGWRLMERRPSWIWVGEAARADSMSSSSQRRPWQAARSAAARRRRRESPVSRSASCRTARARAKASARERAGTDWR